MNKAKFVRLKDIPDAVLNEHGYYAKLPKFFVDQRAPGRVLVKVKGEIMFSHVDGFPLGKANLPVDDNTEVELLN